MPARIVISADGHEVFESWRQAFATVAPDLPVCSWFDPAWQLQPDDYALVWEPEPEHVECLAHMKGIICTGAGVDHLLSLPGFPQDVPLVRMGGEQTARLMADYVLWAVISLLRGLAHGLSSNSTLYGAIMRMQPHIRYNQSGRDGPWASWRFCCTGSGKVWFLCLRMEASAF